MVNFDDDSENNTLNHSKASEPFILNRREFLGTAAVGATVATGVFAQETTDYDDLRLEFVWDDSGPYRVLNVVVVYGYQKNHPKNPTNRDALHGREILWKIRPESFGPNTRIIVGAPDFEGYYHTYTLRLTNASFGRIKGRNQILKFYRRRRPLVGQAVSQFFFGVVLEDDVWSKSEGVLATDGFTLQDEGSRYPSDDVRNSVELRLFCKGNKSLYHETTAKAVANTFVLMFNGLLKVRRGQSNRRVGIRFSCAGEWNIKPRNNPSVAPFSVFGQREEIASLNVYWSDPVGPLKNEADEETPLLAICHPPEERAKEESTYNIGGKFGPGVSVTRLSDFNGGNEPLARSVKLRIQPLQNKAGIPTGLLRAEASLTGAYSNLIIRTSGIEDGTGPFPRLYGTILERADAPARATKINYADRSGTISFQGSYGYLAAPGASKLDQEKTSLTPVGMSTAVGKVVATAVTPEKQTVLAQRQPDFPERVGWPVKALFGWELNKSASRDSPETRWIDARVAMLEAGVRLAEADFSRLKFDPTELRLFYEKSGLLSPPLGSFIDLSAPQSGELARFDLSRAKLRASRSHDLVSLVFSFSDLALSFSRQSTTIIRLNALCDLVTRPDFGDRYQPHDTRPVIVVEYPGQHLFEEARFLPSPPPMPDLGIPVRLTIERANASVIERALYEDDPVLNLYPDIKRSSKPAFEVTAETITLDANNRVHVIEALSMFNMDQRKKLREEILRLKTWLPDPPPNPWPADLEFPRRKREAIAKFAAEAAKILVPLVTKSGLPEDQTTFIGPFALDADAMQAVRMQHEADFSEILARLTEDMFMAVARHQSATPPTNMQDALRQERRLESAIPTYQLFRTFYREVMIASYFDPGSIGAPAAESLEPEEIEFFEASRKAGPEWVSAAKKGILQRRASTVIRLFPEELRGRDDSIGPLRGRLARPSRLAFRINCPDGIDEAEVRHKADLDLEADADARLPRKVLGFSLGELTNFKDYELAVTARAETVYDGGRLGLIDTRHARVPDRRPGAMLDRLGFSAGPGVTAARRLAEVTVSLAPPTPLETSIEIPARLTLSPHQDAIVLTPGHVEPAIYDDHMTGLTPSNKPDQTRLWVTSFLTAKNDVGMDPGLRAVYSPDLRPEALLQRLSVTGDLRSPGNGAPTRGPIAPWFMSRLETQRPLMSGEDAIERADKLLNYNTTTTCEGLLDDPNVRKRYPQIVADLCRILQLNNPAHRAPTGFRTALDAYMRHELVLLSSAWGLPVVGATDENGDFQDRASQFEPDERHKLTDVMPGTAMYRPRTLDVSELGLSSLGGILRHDSGFEPPAGALFWLDNKSLFDALAIERWQQWTNLGRDIHTEIVFKGYLFPLGIRASLVQVTERFFLIERGTGAITATLRQRMFIRVANPERSFPGIKQPHGGRRFPVDRMRVLTTTTPDIVDPQSPARGVVKQPRVSPNGRIDTASATGLAFWPRFVQSPEGNIRFELEIDGVKTDLPLIFIDNTAVNDQDTLRELINYYNLDPDQVTGLGHGVPSPDNDDPQLTGVDGVSKGLTPLDPVRHLRTINFRGENMRYAPELEAGSATFQTYHWTLRATGGSRGYSDVTRDDAGPKMSSGIELKEKLTVVNTDFVFGPVRTGADQPPFYPAIESARIQLTQAERLAARQLGPARVHYDARYVLHGLEPADDSVPEPLNTLNPNEIFLAVRDQHQLDMGNKGDQSGGVYRPSGHVAALSRKKGLMTLTNSVPMDAMPRHDSDVLYGMSSLFAVDENAFQKIDTTGGNAANVAVIDDRKSQELIDKVRAIYRNFFSGDAKILGIVKMRDLIELIKSEAFSSPSAGLPTLSEAQEFGVNVAEGGTDLLNTVREEVVSPLAAGTREVRAGWDRIEETIQGAQSQAGLEGPPIQVRDVFPELDQALSNLSQALDRAKSETDPIEFAFELSVCYTAGQRFLSEIQRAASNPGERIEAAFSAQFGQVLGLFQGALSGRVDLLEQLLARLGFEGSLENARQELIEKYLLTELPTLIAEDAALRRREIIGLPRGSFWYASDGTFDPAKESVLSDCLEVLLPSEELAKETVRAFVAYAATEVLSTSDVPDMNDLVRSYLRYEPRTPPAVCSITGGMGSYFSCVREKFVQLNVPFKDGTLTAITENLQDRLDDIKSDAAGWGLSNQLEAEVERIINDLSVKLDSISVGEAAQRVLNHGSMGERIRNHYIVCLITEFPDSQGKTIPIGSVELRRFRIDLLKYLQRLISGPEDFLEDFLPDLSRLFGALGSLLGAIGKVQASFHPDIDVNQFLSAIREFLEQIGLPINLPTNAGNIPSFKNYFCPTWEVTRAFMAELGAMAEGAALCPEGLVLPSCPLGPDTFDDLADETIPIPVDDVSLCSEVLRFGTNAHDLRRILDDEPKTKLETLRDELAALPPTTDKHKEVLERVQFILQEMDVAGTCLSRIRQNCEDVYCDIQADTARMNTLARDLRAASAIDFCAMTDLNDIKESFDQIMALTNLPRDFESFLDARERLLKRINRFFVEIVEMLQDESGCWRGIPIVVGLKPFIEGMGLGEIADDGTFAVDPGLSDITNEVEEYFEEIQDAGELITEMLTQYARTVCGYSGVLDSVMTHLDRFAGLLESLRQNQLYGAEIADFLSKNANTQRLLRQINGIGDEMVRIIELRDKYCPPSDPPEFPTIRALADVKIGTESSLDFMGAADSAVSRISNGVQGIARDLAPMATVLRPIVEKGPRDGVMAVLDPYAQQLLDTADDTVVSLYSTLKGGRDALGEKLDGIPFLSEVKQKIFILPTNTRPSNDQSRPVFVPFDRNGDGEPGADNDQLAGDVAWLSTLAQNTPINGAPEGNNGHGPLTDPQRFAFLSAFVTEWLNGEATPVRILLNLQDVIEDVLKGEFFRAIDFNRLREEFEEYLLSLVPTSIRMGYDFDIELGSEVASATRGIFAPGPGTALNVAMNINVSLDPSAAAASIDYASVGTLGPFDIKLVGDMFDALTLKFASARFESKSEQKPGFDIEYLDYVIGPELDFLQDLQSFLSPKDGSGAFVRFDPSQPGVEAGYRLQLGDFSVGALAFSNVGLETSAVLPFSDDEALFRASLSSRASPFTLTYAPYGGSGFFAILATPGSGIIGFEALFEFGGSAVFAFGPLSGQGRLMSGVYVRQLKMGNVKITEISMTFFAGGSASIWIFHFSAALLVNLGMVEGNMSGQATFSFSFSMGLADFEYSVDIWKQEEKGFNGQSQANLMGSPESLRQFAFLQPENNRVPRQLRKARIRVEAVCQSQNCAKYKTYFEKITLPEDYF